MMASAIRTALNDAANPHVKIFRSSFDNDRLGVAMMLLRWRDALIKMDSSKWIILKNNVL